MPTLEGALSAFEAEIVEAQKAADALLKAIKKLGAAAKIGHLADLERGLAAIGERRQQAVEAAERIGAAWDFDVRSHLASGYVAELLQVAEEQGVRLVERDGRLFAFPLMLRIDARDASVRLGKKTERRLRPKHLVKLLADAQKRPLRFREERFLALLYDVYQRLTAGAWRKEELALGPAISLSDMHGLLTMLPGADYPIEEFGRDLLLLDRHPDLQTRDGASFEFQGAALARGSMKRIVTYDDSGNERMYIAIRFLGNP